MRIDKQQAYSLRQQGKTYKEIASEIGCSLDWCKRNLKGVVIDTHKAMLDLANSPSGISNADIQRLSPDSTTKVTKQRIRRASKDALIRPDFICPNDPQSSLDELYALAHSLNERIHDAIFDYLSKYPNTNRQAVMKELVRLSSPWLLPEGIELHCDRLSSTVHQMILRKNTPT